jgi:alpha-galactosidase
MRSLFAVAAALVCLASAQAQSVTGRWTGNFSTVDNGLQIEVALTQSGGQVTGYMISPRFEGTFVEGKAEGNSVTLITERPGRGAGAQPIRQTYTGTLENGKMRFSTTTPGRGGQQGATPQTQTYELTRISTEAPKPLPAPPPRLALPDPAPVKSNGMGKTPQMGWNSWNKFSNRVSDKMVREMADAMVTSGMRDAGYIYVNIDDTWEAGRDAKGNILTNNKFPDMKALSDYLHKKGLKLGIYSSPGPRTCAGYLGSYQHEEQDAKQYAAWGIDYLKYDWCSATQVYDDAQSTMAAAYAKMGNALLNSGRKIFYSLCQYGQRNVGEWGEKVGGNSWRTTGDIGDRWQSMDRIGFDQQLGREKFAGPGHWNDPDMLEIGNGGMTDEEYRTHMSLWCILASPLLAGNDIRDMKQNIKDILMNKEVIAVNQDKLGKQGVRVAKEGTLEVWSKPLADGGYAVGLFNRGAATAKVTAKWSDVGAKGSHAVRDLWAHKDLGKMADTFSAEVPSHGVVMIRIAK